MTGASETVDNDAETVNLGTPVVSGRHSGWYQLGILIIAYTFSYIDRSILTLMVGPIRASLKISDVQLSLLQGFAFAIFYTFLGIPIGRLIDRYRRTNIVASGIALWSVATALCGFASSFGGMFIARIGVGVGESTLTPAAYSMLADRFSGKRLVHALAGYNSAIYLGPAIATLFGGVLLGKLVAVDTVFGHFAPWQIVFVIVGLPGLLITVLVATMGEPVRQGDTGAKLPGFGAVLAHMRNHARAYGLLILGLCCQSVMWNGALAWIPTYFIRDFGWTPVQVGLRYAPVIAVAGTSGCMGGGWLAGRLRDGGRADANVLIGVMAALAALPFAIAAPLVGDARLALALFGGFLFAGAMPYGAAAAAFQEITPNRMRGQVSAIYLFWLNLAGIGLGSMLVALVTEHFFGNDMFVGRAIASVAGTSAILSAVILGASMKPYRQAMAAQT